MAEGKPRKEQSKKKLAYNQISVDYPPPTEQDSLPVRGGKRAPDKGGAASAIDEIKARMRKN